jgi:hypothetical protein
MKLRLVLALCALAMPAYAQSLPTPNLGCSFKINGTTVGCPAAVAVGGTGVATIVGIVKGNGTSPFSAAVAGSDYATPTTAVSAGSGLTGGGDLSASRTISLDPKQFGWGLRNRLFNSAMQVDQRNSGASVALAAVSGTTNYTVDRWYAYEASAGSGLTAQQTTINTGGIAYALRVQRANASTNTSATSLAQVLESPQNIDLQSTAVTLSYQARIGANFSPTSAQITAAIITGTAINQSAASFAAGTWTGQSTCGSATPAITTSFVTYVVTCAIPGNATQVGVKFAWTWAGTAGANDWIDLTNIELVPGTFTAAQIAPENRPVGLVKQLCQRFYNRRSLSIRTFSPASGVFYEENVQLDMRATPAATLAAAGTRGGPYGGIQVNVIDATGARFGMGSTTGAGDMFALGDIWAFDAEL